MEVWSAEMYEFVPLGRNLCLDLYGFAVTS